MNERLQKVIQAKKQEDQDQADADAAKRKKEEDWNARVKTATMLWSAQAPEIQQAIIAVNKELKESGLELKYEHAEHEGPAISRDEIRLYEDGEFQRRFIVLNVSALGRVQIVLLISHTGRGRQFDIEEATKDLWIDVITDFLEQVMSGRKKTDSA